MRKILVLALAVMMVLAMVPTVAMAAEEKGSEVIAASEVSYTITIPDRVDLGTLTKGESKSKEFPVSASDVFLEDGGFIDLTVRGNGPDGAFVLYDLEGLGSNSLAYALKGPNDNNVTPGGSYARITGNGSQTGSVGVTNASIPFAGSYKGIMTFTISYVGPEVQDATAGSADMKWLVICESTTGSVDILFRNWEINQLTSMEVAIYKDGVKISTTRLKNPGSHSGKNITCSLRTSDNWVNDKGVTEARYYKGQYDSVSVKVVKDGKTYIFKSSAKQ